MNRRERLILIAVASVIGLTVLYGLLNSLILTPRAALLAKIATRQETLDDHTQRIKRKAKYQAKLRDLVKQTYVGGYDETGDDTRSAVGWQLETLAKEGNLRDTSIDFRALTLGSADSRGGFRQIGWNASGVVGTLTEVTDFLYKLDRMPYLRRIEDVRVSPDLAAGTVQLSFRYTTLAVSRSAGKSKRKITTATTRPTSRPAAEPIELDTPDRAQYDGIASRDMFRPFMAKPTPKPVVRRAQPKPTAKPKPTRRKPPSTDQHFQVVSLSSWYGDAPVVVVDKRNPKNVDRYYLDDSFGGGTIVGIDRRPMPMPNQDKINSLGRVIFKIKNRYWAVELGHTLAQKHVMTPDKLPQDVRDRQLAPAKPSPTSAPAAKPAGKAATGSGRVDVARSSGISRLQQMARSRVRELAASTETPAPPER